MFDRNSKFPKDLSLKIVSSYLGFKDTLNLKRVNKASNVIAGDNFVWEEKIKQHFPHVYEAVLKRRHEEKIDWHAQFRNAYVDEYRNLRLQQKTLFSMVKEGDVEGLKALQHVVKLSDSYVISDSNRKTLLEWAKQQQAVLDYFYSLAKKMYQDPVDPNAAIDVRTTDKGERTLLDWACGLNQLDAINPLISQGADVNANKSGSVDCCKPRPCWSGQGFIRSKRH